MEYWVQKGMTSILRLTALLTTHHSNIPVFHYSTTQKVKNYTQVRSLIVALHLELPENKPVLGLIQPGDTFLFGRLYGQAVVFNRKM